MDFIPIVIALVLGAGAGVGGFYVYNKRNENGGKDKADELIRYPIACSKRRKRTPQRMEKERGSFN